MLLTFLNKNKIRVVIFNILWISLFKICLLSPQPIMGDGLEYIVQTQSILLNHSISIDREQIANYWNRTNPFKLNLFVSDIKENKLIEQNQAGGGFGSLYASANSKFYYVHSWVYSLVVSPVYRVFKFLNIDEYRSFQFVNSLLLSLVLCTSNYILAFFILCSPIAGYLTWSCPEVFQFSLLAFGFYLLEAGKLPYYALFFIALAAAQNFPSIAFLFIAIFLYNRLFELSNKLNLLKLILIMLVATSPWCFYATKFGTANLILSLKMADARYSSLPRLYSFLFSPVAGAFFYFPAAFILLPILNRNKALVILITTLSLSYSMTSMVNLHSQQIACQRYFAWLLAPALGILSFEKINLKKNLPYLLVVFALILFNRNYLFITTQHPRSGYLWPISSRASFIYRWTHFSENPEVLTEIALGRELPAPHEFNASYEIPIGETESICIVSLRAFKSDPTLNNSFKPKEVVCGKLRQEVGIHKHKWSRDTVLGGYLLSYEKQ